MYPISGDSIQSPALKTLNEQFVQRRVAVSAEGPVTEMIAGDSVFSAALEATNDYRVFCRFHETSFA